ncbi:hypothetical protein W97_02910 [Coniosporium apollinis CBS 100218]|uniref:Protein CSF1 n=1 Tax=Coniosporium apollinis (strain CBS 100218) TaxID=1168221 RepID=R7YP60_CONA1|nr:uncharacterized protein W97_02910 [Coniosporium apollinis CBS 100218]EON63682.1 hypothetical protein W97_02910 [Coniosporium apollinis CBS 100218]
MYRQAANHSRTVFFLFYFNRLFATLVSYGIRAYTWHKYRAYIDIQALQISLLAGRIFFKDLRYHGHNETILVHGGYITWRYWYRNVRESELFTHRKSGPSKGSTSEKSTSQKRSTSRSLDREEKAGDQVDKQLPCRISIKISGLEAFLYNRSPAYDSVVEAVTRAANSASSDDESRPEAENGEGKSSDISFDEKHEAAIRPSKTTDSARSQQTNVSGTHSHGSQQQQSLQLPAFLHIFPIRLSCNKGAVALGNENTKCVLTAKFDNASGEFDVGEAGELDIYKQIFHFNVVHPVVHMRPNTDFKSFQLATAIRLKQEARDGPSAKHAKAARLAHPRHNVLQKLHNLSPFFRKSVESVNPSSQKADDKTPSAKLQTPLPGEGSWRGLTRYLDNSQFDEHDEWDAVEYGKSSLIADITRVSFSFYWDIPGPKPQEIEGPTAVDSPIRPDVNGASPPDYGLELYIYGGIVNYGPWADRQRINFQSFFFPSSYVDAHPAKPLAAGQTRIITVFKLFLTVEEEVTLRVPTREPSKDWKWRGRAENMKDQAKLTSEREKGRGRGRIKSFRNRKGDKGLSGPNVRPFGWIDVKFAPDTTVNYTMDMVAQKDGYANTLVADVRGIDIYSSVNHGLLWHSGKIGLDCDLSFPLRWNGLRQWTFNISCNDLELFLLRDHLFLITDIVGDWGSGPPSEYYTFTPFRYKLNMNFSSFKMYLNTNDSNIVNDPSDLEDNNFIVLYGRTLYADLLIPLDRFRPARNEIRFDVRGYDFGLEMRMPSKNTVNTFVKSNNVATLEELAMDGSHNYFTSSSASLTDTLSINIHGSKFSLILYGFLVRHLMKVKDNYFGDDLHFRTLEEFQNTPRRGSIEERLDISKQGAKKSNDLDVILCIGANDASILLPANLYSADEYIRADVPYAFCDLRFTNYYMDLMVDFSPASISVSDKQSDQQDAAKSSGRTQLFIDLISIYGHRLFGLPPTEPTYLCNYDFNVGKITGESSARFLETLLGAIQAFAFGLDDDENAMPLTEPLVIHDVIFIRLKAAGVNICLRTALDALIMGTGAITLDFNDWAGSTFSQRLNVLVPNLTLACFDPKSPSPKRTGSEMVTAKTHAYLQTDISLHMLKRKLGFSEERQKQQAHLNEHDQRTDRTPFLLHDELDLGMSRPTRAQSSLSPPASTYPAIPSPLRQINSDASSTSRSSLRSSRSTRSGNSIATSITSLSSDKNEARRAGRIGYKSSLHSQSDPSLAGSLHAGNSSSSSGQFGHRSSSEASREEQKYSQSYKSARGRRKRQEESSEVLTSSLARPEFPLDGVALDVSDVPPLTPPSRKEVTSVGNSWPALTDGSRNTFDENFVHTSFIITAGSGVRALCTPQAVASIAVLIQSLQPKHPEDLLDSFQIEVMSKILSIRNRIEGKGTSNQFSLRLPCAHLRFSDDYSTIDESHYRSEKDQYDVIVENLGVAARSRSYPKTESETSSFSFHATLDSLDASVKDSSRETNSDDAAVRARIDDVLFWMVSAGSTSVNASFKGFEIVTAGKRIEYLARLIHHTTLLADDLRSQFANLDAQSQWRLRFFAYTLTMLGGETPDPPFLSRPSYALRAATDHLRNHDSWKIISRFRYIYDCLSPEQKEDLVNRCLGEFPFCPADAEGRVISSWDQWRTWDLAHVKRSLAMRKLYGSWAEVNDLHENKQLPVGLTVRSTGIRLILDPGPKQSELSTRMLMVALSMSPPQEPSGLMLVENDASSRKTTLHTSSKSLTCQINWEVCELVENLLRLFQEGQSFNRKPSVSTVGSVELAEVHEPQDHDIQVFVTTDYGSIALESINLRNTWTVKSLKASVIATDRAESSAGFMLSTLVHADSAAVELQSHRRLLMHCRADGPNVYVSKDNSDQSDTWRIAGASKKVLVQIKEEIIGLVEVSDAVLCDEVAYFQRRRDLFAQGINPGNKHHTTQRSAPSPKLDLALLMDAYQIDVAIFQSMSYSISGELGRLSAVPVLGHEWALNLNYDLSSSIHHLRSNTSQRSQNIAELGMPPFNGVVQLTHSGEQTVVGVSMIIERINLDAHALHGLLTAAQSPEGSSAIRAIQDDVNVFKTHLAEVFPKDVAHSSRQSEEPSKSPLAFDASIIFAGLCVSATAPGSQSDSSKVKMVFELSPVKIKATNVSLLDRLVLPMPEIIVQLQQMTMELKLFDNRVSQRCGNVTFGVGVQCLSYQDDSGQFKRDYRVQSSALEVNLFPDTASAVVDVINHLQNRLSGLDLSKEKKYLRRLRQPRRLTSTLENSTADSAQQANEIDSAALFDAAFSMELPDIQISYIVGNSAPAFPGHEVEDLVLSFRRIGLSSKKENAARLTIEDLQLQMVPASQSKRQRSPNSALLPEVVFNVAYSSTQQDRQYTFHAGGKSLDVRLESKFLLSANVLQQSMKLANKELRAVTAGWKKAPSDGGVQRSTLFANKKLSSLLVDADFAGAVVYLHGSSSNNRGSTKADMSHRSRLSQRGRYGQFSADDSTPSTALRAPSIALKVQYKGNVAEPTLHVELKIDASTNTLHPTVVPLIVDISNCIKEIVQDGDGVEKEPEPKSSSKSSDEESLVTADPSALLGKTRLNFGFRICRQEFSLSCQPIARVAATACIEDIYVTANTIRSTEHGHFFALSATFDKLQASVQHDYSRESTFSFDVESVVLSLMNSKHLSGTSGISAILKIDPMRTHINARQLQDFLLFREIWLPPEIRKGPRADLPSASTEPQEYFVQRYQQVASAAAFPWNATILIAEIAIDLDLGQSIGKSSLIVTNLWASSKKSSDSEQNLCIGVQGLAINSNGRMSGFVDLDGFKVRTSIRWPSQAESSRKSPLVQAAVGFTRLRVKVAFDFQAFVIADISSFNFLMHNVRVDQETAKDRLVAILDGEKVQIFCTATSAAQGYALYQALERLIQENEMAYKQSLKDIEKFLRRSSTTATSRPSLALPSLKQKGESLKAPISLHTDVVVTLQHINFGAFPSTFSDHQILSLEAHDVQARFAVALERHKIHSGLGMTLGQLSLALAAVSQPKAPKTLGEVSLEEVVRSATTARGGTILRVPKVIATMQTWQEPDSNHIDYTFKSAFEGKVDVGWNYSRISFIRTMHNTHTRTLASRLGRQLPESAVKIAGLPDADDADGGSLEKKASPEKEKITAVVNVPQSKYNYTALETPIIETPQLRDMGEATPPLEWIGLHRERLPNVTHQIVIVTLLELAKEVEDAYSRILGSS